jgi:ABC-type multidrug transport system fused ATPase/permease subunit
MRVEVLSLRLLRTYGLFFYRLVGRRMIALVVLMTVMSYAEGFGISLFFPLFAGSGGGPAADSPMRFVFRLLHLESTPRAVLPVIVGVFTAKGVLFFITVTYQYFLASQIARKLRGRLIAALGAADYLYITRTTSGFHANILTNEVNRAEQAFVNFARALPSAINVGVFFLIVLLLDWQLTASCVVMGLLLVVALRFPGRIVREYSAKTTQENGLLATLLIQCVQGFKYLRATASFDRFKRRIDGSAAQLAHLEYRSGAATALLFSVSQPLMVVFIAAVLYFRLGSNNVASASLFLVLIYLFRIMSELFTLQTNWQAFCSYSGGVDVTSRVADELAAAREASGTTPYPGFHESLSSTQVSFAYGDGPPVLEDVTLTVPKNGSVAFVGESGAGKSTLVDLLIGVLRPTRGQVRVDGVDLTELALEDFRGRVGYVPQDPVLFDDTIENNISLWTDAPRERVRDAAERAHCLRFIEEAPGGFGARVGERAIQLSGGQKQRLAIARELFRQPEILVLDEATSALDSESERAIQRSIDELKGQITLVIIAHRLSTVRNCDHIYVLDRGHIIEEGKYDELLARPGSRFRAMCELQNLLPRQSTSSTNVP